jgi:hypothetical protein
MLMAAGSSTTEKPIQMWNLRAETRRILSPDRTVFVYNYPMTATASAFQPANLLTA